MTLIIRLFVKWWRPPAKGGFAELDQQILKFRQLKEEYSKNPGSSYTDRSSSDLDRGQRRETCTP